MKVIIRREWKNYLKTPLYWLAFLIFLLGIWQMTSPYLTVHYFQSEEDLMSREVSAPADRDIMEGYIRQPEERMIRESFPEIRRYLVDEDGFGMSDEEADAVLDTMLSEHMTVEEADRYMEETYSFLGAGSFMEDYEYGRAGLEETNAWIRQKMEEHPYSWYLARKFTDALSLYVGFGSAVLLAFLFMRDTRRDTYELLHTKPVGAGSYVAGKVLGGFLPILLLILLLTGCFTVLGAVTAVREGFPYQPLDFAVDAALYLLPNLLMIVSIYAAVALIFRNPLPAVPLVILYMLYSNMGTMTEEGYQYIGKPLAIMIRFDGKFFETSVPEMAYRSQPALLLVSAVLRIVLFSTHVVEDLAATCSQLAVMRKGRFLYEGSVIRLLNQARGHVWLCETDSEETARELEQRFRVASRQYTERGMSMKFVGDEPPESGKIRCRPVEITLEDAYLYLMNREE